MITKWNVFEHLSSEEEIAAFLDGAFIEGEGDAVFYMHCLNVVAQARLVNQIARESGIDRKLLCDMFQDYEGVAGDGNGEAFKANAGTILNAAKSLLEPAHA
jgi:probable addiction module antidote protein